MRIGEMEVPDAPEDPAELASLYGPFGFFDHWRKCVLAQAQELIRAKYATAQEKITESRLDSLARIHPAYLDFLDQHLQGRIRWEREVLKQGVGA